jgi:GT2 family glycosyltransferase
VTNFKDGLLEAASFTPFSVQSPNAWCGHLPFAAWLIRVLEPKIFVELGTHTGNSYFAFCQTVSARNLVTKCYAVDTWCGDEHAGYYGNEVFEHVNTHNQTYYANFSRLLRMNFDDAVSCFSESSIELLHIDGLHTYEAVRHDFETWLPKLSPGAVVLFHDTNVRERGFGVWKFWEELQVRYSNCLEFPHSHGLGVLQLEGVSVGKKLSWLDSNTMEGQQLRSYFSALGARQLERLELCETKRHVAILERTMAERDGQIAQCDGQIKCLNQRLAERDGQIATLVQSLAARDAQIQSFATSRSWRITIPLRLAGKVLRRDFGSIAAQLQNVQKRNSNKKAISYLCKICERLIPRMYGLSIPRGFALPQAQDPYQSWLEVNKFTAQHAKLLHARLEATNSVLPRISIIMPVYDPNPKYLDLAIRSVIDQIYHNWELCIADDASTDEDVHATILHWQTTDSRIRVIKRSTNGNISIATNDAVELSTCEFLAFLDHDDLLAPDALAESALALAENPEADLLYSDDDKVDENGRRFAPQFKPDWSPELLLSYMYLSHLVIVRRSLFKSVGGMRPGFEGSQDYDFILRASEQARKKVIHLPYVLYHWRAVKGSTAISGNAKPSSFEAGRRAVQDALARRGIIVPVIQQDWAKRDGLGIYRPVFSDHGPSVTVVIPTKNQWKVLDRCLQSLKKTSYVSWKVLVIDNDSDEDESIRYLNSLSCDVIRISNPGTSFNFAYVNNRAACQTQTEYVLFLNNDTEVISPDWLSAMVGYGGLEGVGAVGARLIYPDQRVQHAGIVHGLYDGLAGPAFKLIPAWHPGYLARARVAQNTGAVTAACMLTPRQLFLKQGGFDEANFGVAYNDVDYCYRLTDAGYRCVVAGEAELVHHEGLSRGFDDDPREIAAFKRKYRKRIDRWYNPNLSLDDEQFAVRRVRLARGLSKTPVRAFMCAHNLNWEGAPFSQLEMTVALKEQGLIDPIVFTTLDGPIRSEYERQGIPVIISRSPLEGVSTRVEYERAISAFGEQIRQHGAEVLYANTLLGFWAIDAADHLGIPSVWNVRESEPWQTYYSFLGKEVAACALSCFSKPYRVIFVSNSTRRQNEVLNTSNNFTVIHNALNLGRLIEPCAGLTYVGARAALGIETEEVSIFLPGTVCERKGQKDLVLAAELLHRKGISNFKIFIVGDRSSLYSLELHQLITTLPAECGFRVKVAPETNNLSPYWLAADIFVCTSRLESYPRVTLEAMAFGLPIVTTGVYGIMEQVRPGRNAFIYEPGDVQSFAAHLEKLVLESELRKSFAQTSKAVLSCLTSFDDMVEAYGSVFKEAKEINLT